MSKFHRKGERDWKRICLNSAIVIALVVVLFFQVTSLVAFHLEAIFYIPTAILEATWLTPVWIPTIVVIYAAVVLCKVWRTKEKLSLIPAVMSVIGAAPAVMIAMTIRAAYDKVVGRDGTIALTGWEWFMHHGTLVLIAAVTLVVCLVHYKNARDERVHKENEGYTETFNFDAENPLLENDQPGKKLSKKQRKAQKEK